MVDWGGKIGSQPALIIQNDIGNKHSSYTIVAYMAKTLSNGSPIQVNFKSNESGLDQGGTIELWRVMTIPKRMLVDKVGQLSSRKMSEVDEAIKVSLGLEGIE